MTYLNGIPYVASVRTCVRTYWNRRCGVRRTNFVIVIKLPVSFRQSSWPRTILTWSQNFLLPSHIQPPSFPFFTSLLGWKMNAISYLAKVLTEFSRDYCSVLSKWEFFIKKRAALLAPILPRVMKERAIGSSHFDEILSFWWKTLILIGH